MTHEQNTIYGNTAYMSQRVYIIVLQIPFHLIPIWGDIAYML